MRLGLALGYSGSKVSLPMDLIQEADRLGYYSVWTAEAYGSDAITPLARIGAQTKHIRLVPPSCKFRRARRPTLQ